MTSRLKITFAYRGSRYHGWQRQKNSKLTIQAVMEDVFSKIAGHRVVLTASGRTDSGVHARIQVAHLDFETRPFERYSSDNFQGLIHRINTLLPEDIRILKIEKSDPYFHAQSAVKGKIYLYFVNPNLICSPDLTHYTWNLRLPLNWDAISQSARLFQGTHNFKGFCSSDTSAKTFTRTIDEVRVEEVLWKSFWGTQKLRVLRFQGKGFLKYQVRAMVGTLIKVGEGKISPQQISEVLETQNRKLCGPTAPSKGLWLWDILY